MRPTLPLICLFSLLPHPLPAQTSPVPATSPATPAAVTKSYTNDELDAMIIGGSVVAAGSGKSSADQGWLKSWRKNASSELRVNTSVGYKDNALYSAFNPVGTTFARTSAEWTLFGLPNASPWQWYGFSLLENTHNFTVPQMPDEQLFMLMAEAKRPVGDQTWKLGAQLQYFYFHQAFDVSLNELVSSSSIIRLHQAEFRPLVEKTFLVNWTASLQGIASVSRFATKLDDYDRYGARLALTRRHGEKNKGKLELSLTDETRFYTHRTQRSLTGANITGTELDRGQLTGELLWKQPLFENFSSTSRLRLRREGDNGPGYYDADHFQLSQKFSWEPKDWDISVGYKFQRWNWDNQAVAGIRHRRVSDSVEARVEHTLNKSWRIFLAAEFEYNGSDQISERYPRSQGEMGVSFIY